MLTLRAEIAACLVAVGLLGLLSGWMMQRARAVRRLRDTVAEIESRHADIQDNLQRDADNLEERLEALANETRTLTEENRTLRDHSRGGEQTLDTARTEAIELNRRQIETQERLQRIIRERDREIAALRGGGRSIAERPSANDERTPPLDGLDETVRIDPALLPTALAAHVNGERGGVATPSDDTSAGATDGPPDDTLETTIDVTFLEAEEATVALDEETLSLVRSLGRGKRER